jgi:hypothetical protein
MAFEALAQYFTEGGFGGVLRAHVSVYCLLAFLPYSFFFLIRAPAYAWMPWFVHHQAILYWLAAAAAVAANWRFADSPKSATQDWLSRDRTGQSARLLVESCIIVAVNRCR